MSFRFILIYVSKSSHFNINLSTFFFGCDNIFIALATLLTKYYNFSAIQMFEQKKNTSKWFDYVCEIKRNVFRRNSVCKWKTQHCKRKIEIDSIN